MRVTIKRKQFTRWDETDNLKKMKDSDILAEKKKQTTNWGSAVRSGLTGAAIGSAVGLTGGAASTVAAAVKNRSLSGALGAAKNIRKLGTAGALAGAGIGAGVSLLRGRKQANENAFYNQRLEYAQNQARRRERKDWKTNMTQRDGYSY